MRMMGAKRTWGARENTHVKTRRPKKNGTKMGPQSRASPKKKTRLLAETGVHQNGTGQRPPEEGEKSRGKVVGAKKLPRIGLRKEAVKTFLRSCRSSKGWPITVKAKKRKRKKKKRNEGRDVTGSDGS